MSLTAVLLTGLFAGGISCAAVQGGLLAGLVARQHSPTASAASPTRSRSADRRARTADDLLPVTAFLAGKLASHTMLGALLGAVGAAVQLSPAARAWMQVSAGAVIVAFGLAQLGVGPFRRLTVTPPASWLRLVRGRARSEAAFAPAVLGFATVLVPCGVTVSVQALALASGSAGRGALVMAVFVLGTAPLFALLGYAARRAVGAWHGRLAAATGLVLLATGLFTVNGGLTVVDSPLAARNWQIGPDRDAASAPAPAAASTGADGRQEIVIVADAESYQPETVSARAGVPTTLVVRAEGARGCVRAFVIESMNRQWTLPTNGDTRIDLGLLPPGDLLYSCAMGMYSGQITAVEPQGS